MEIQFTELPWEPKQFPVSRSAWIGRSIFRRVRARGEERKRHLYRAIKRIPTHREARLRFSPVAAAVGDLLRVCVYHRLSIDCLTNVRASLTNHPQVARAAQARKRLAVATATVYANEGAPSESEAAETGKRRDRFCTFRRGRDVPASPPFSTYERENPAGEESAHGRAIKYLTGRARGAAAATKRRRNNAERFEKIIGGIVDSSFCFMLYTHVC